MNHAQLQVWRAGVWKKTPQESRRTTEKTFADIVQPLGMLPHQVQVESYFFVIFQKMKGWSLASRVGCKQSPLSTMWYLTNILAPGIHFCQSQPLQHRLAPNASSPSTKSLESYSKIFGYLWPRYFVFGIETKKGSDN